MKFNIFPSINIESSDTTISRASAGRIAVEGVNVLEQGDNASMLVMNTNKLLGRNTALSGTIEEITLGTGLSFTGTTLNATGGGGLTWGTSVTGTTGTGVLLTMDNSYAASGIGQSIVIGNTQTNALRALNINTGTSVLDHTGISISILKGQGSSAGGGISINNYASATESLGRTYGISIGNNFNTTASTESIGVFIMNMANATGRNCGIIIDNRMAQAINLGLFSPGSGLHINHRGSAGTGLTVYGNSSIATNTNGVVNFTLDNTQSAASIMQKIDLGTSAQGHTGLQISLANASSTSYGVSVNQAGTGTGAGYLWRHGTSTSRGYSWTHGGTGNYGGSMISNEENAGATNFGTSQLINVSNSAMTSSATSKTVDFISVINCSGKTSGSGVTDNYNLAYLERKYNFTGTVSASTSTGSVLRLVNNLVSVTNLTDSAVVLSLSQSNSSTGGHIRFNAYSGTPTTNNTFWYDGTNFKYIDNAGTTKTITAI